MFDLHSDWAIWSVRWGFWYELRIKRFLYYTMIIKLISTKQDLITKFNMSTFPNEKYSSDCTIRCFSICEIAQNC